MITMKSKRHHNLLSSILKNWWDGIGVLKIKNKNISLQENTMYQKIKQIFRTRILPTSFWFKITISGFRSVSNTETRPQKIKWHLKKRCSTGFQLFVEKWSLKMLQNLHEAWKYPNILEGGQGNCQILNSKYSSKDFAQGWWETRL